MAEVQQLVQEFEGRQAARSNWDSLWQRVYEATAPDSATFTTHESPGTDRTGELVSTRAASAAEKFGAVFESLLTPRNQRFQGLAPSLPSLAKSKAVTNYFEELTTRLFKVRRRPRAGFHDSAFESWKSLAIGGNQCFHAIPSKDRKGISYRNIHIGAIWIALDDRGQLDTVFYRWKYTARQALLRWGDLAPESAKKSMKDNKPSEQHLYLHVVKPRQVILPNRLGPESMAFESWEISLTDNVFIMQKDPLSGEMRDSGGLRTNPYIYSRFSTNSGEDLGRGPGMMVLGDNESLQRMKRSALLYGEHAVTPPLLAQSTSLLSDGTSRLDLRAAAVNPGWLDAAGRERVKAMDNRFNFPVLDAMRDEAGRAIDDAHLVTLFQILVDTPEMTATEALIRAQEKGQLIAPSVGRQQTEFLGPLTEREISILSDLDMLPEMPQELVEAQGEYKIEYSSAATQIQREEEVQAVRATFVDALGIAEMDETAREVLDAPAAIRFIAEARRVPSHIIRSEKQFDEIIAAQAEANQQDKMLEMAPGLAKAAKDASQIEGEVGAVA